MKKLLTLLAIIPMMASARNFEFGINAGPNLLFFTNGNSSFTTKGLSTKTAKGIFASFKLMTDVGKNGQIGMGVDVGSLKHDVRASLYNNKCFGFASLNDVSIAGPYVHIYTAANKVLQDNNVKFYGGVNIGLLIATGEVLESVTNNYIETYKVSDRTETTTNLTVGFQTGLSFTLNKDVDLNVELAPRLLNFSGMVLLPLSAGLRVKI